MSTAQPLRKHPPLTQFIHWAVGLAVLSQLAIAVVLSQLRSLQYGQFVLGMHRQLGLAILILSLFRIASLARHRVAQLDAELPAWQILAARLVHYGIYAALILQPMLGILISWGRGDTVTVFGMLTLPAPWDVSDAARDRFMAAHIATASTLVALLIVHLAAVIFNHRCRHVPVMDRMLPATPADQLVNHVPLLTQMLAALGVIIVIALATGVNTIVKYRAFTQLTTDYRENDQVADEEAAAAQLAWKELVGLRSSSRASDGAGDDVRGRKLALAARDHLDGAAAHATDPSEKAALFALIKQIGDLDAHGLPYAPATVGEIDARLQDAIDNQAGAAQQAQGDFAERTAQGHDLIVVSVAPMALLGIILALLLARTMSFTVGRLRALVRGIETGTGSAAIRVRGRGEFAELMRGMIAMRSAVETRARLAADQQRALEAERAQVMEDQRAQLREAELRRTADHATLQREAEQRQAGESQALRERLAEDFESQIAGIVDAVAQTIDTLKRTAANLAQSAAATTRCSAEASLVAGSTKESASRMAASSAQLSLAAQSVRQNAEQSKARAILGVREATAAKTEIDLLAAASQEINSITELISAVTRQTNLLAINARIEAARAGEAGKGFCIVADEVKTLAGKTHSATLEIGSQVGHVTKAASRSIDIIQNMRSIIGDLESGSSGIFSACDDQSKSTDDIASKVAQISASIVSAAENIAGAERTARDTEVMASEVVDTACALQDQADSLQDRVAKFVSQLRCMHGGTGNEPAATPVPGVLRPIRPRAAA